MKSFCTNITHDAFCLVFSNNSVIGIIIIYTYMDPHAQSALITTPLLDLIINFFLVTFSTSMIGLFISSVVRELRVTLIVAPLYMMVQILFAGMFLAFTDATRLVSHIIIGRWGYESFGSINNVYYYGTTSTEPGFFDFTKGHVLGICAIFIAVIIACLLLCIFSIKRSILSKDG